MNYIKPIRSDADLDAALARIEELIDASEGSPEEDELDALVELVAAYESSLFPKEFPDPVAAIEFRMEQAGLVLEDLIPYIGSRAKVSEVLSGKRAITMTMAQALHQHLGIPAEALLQKPTTVHNGGMDNIDPHRFPLKTMAKRGWIPDVPDLKERAEEFISSLMASAGGPTAISALYRKNDQQRVNAETDQYALMAWCWKVLTEANNRTLPNYQPGVVNSHFMLGVAQLSAHTDGPIRAREFLGQHGIALETVPHLSKTYLDCAAFLATDGRPVIGLSLRYDRIDNFWFSLMHELAHVSCHLDKGEADFFVDDLTLDSNAEYQHSAKSDSVEYQADLCAAEALIPPSVWETSPVRETPTRAGIISLAQELGIHPAIIAGRIRHERKNYRLLSQLVGSGQVKRQFGIG